MKHGCLRSEYTTTGEQQRTAEQVQQRTAEGTATRGAMDQWEERNAPITADLLDVHCAVQSNRPHC